MVDDVDDLLRNAMKTLDDQVPPGYFDDLPGRTLARLDDASIAAEPEGAAAGASDPEPEPVAPPAPVLVAVAAPAAAPAVPEARPRDEDSDLHDIRSLASSQRLRIKRSSQSGSHTDDEILASASGSWRAVALPEPARMVSLPELSELPSAREVEEAGKAGRASKPRLEPRGEPSPDKAAARPGEAASAVEPPAATPITAAKARPAAGGTGKRRALMAVGLGLAAAAGAVFFVSTQRDSKEAAAPSEAADGARVSAPLPELRQVTPPAAVIADPETAAAAAGTAAVAEPPPDVAADKGKAATPTERPGKSAGKYVPNVVDEPSKKPDRKRDDPKKKPEPGDPDFDKLLKEAGYQEKKAEAPKLEKKSLTSDDIKKGMSAVAPRVASCYAGTEGAAVVKLTVAPTGQVQKVTVTGQFAGTPTGACVEGAIQGVTFPPWDGGPQSVSYSYLLAE